MVDLRKLFTDWQAGRFKYPQIRRETEDAFFGGLVDVLTDLQVKTAGLRTDADIAAAKAANAAQWAAAVEADRARRAAVAPRRGPGRPPKAEDAASMVEGKETIDAA